MSEVPFIANPTSTLTLLRVFSGKIVCLCFLLFRIIHIRYRVENKNAGFEWKSGRLPAYSMDSNKRKVKFHSIVTITVTDPFQSPKTTGKHCTSVRLPKSVFIRRFSPPYLLTSSALAEALFIQHYNDTSQQSLWCEPQPKFQGNQTQAGDGLLIRLLTTVIIYPDTLSYD
jgi:hypothetical protein